MKTIKTNTDNDKEISRLYNKEGMNSTAIAYTLSLTKEEVERRMKAIGLPF